MCFVDSCKSCASKLVKVTVLFNEDRVLLKQKVSFVANKYVCFVSVEQVAWLDYFNGSGQELVGVNLELLL